VKVFTSLMYIFAFAMVQGLVFGADSGTAWQAHIVRQMNAPDAPMEIPARIQIVTERWNRVVAVPYIVYMPEKDRLLMLVGCDYPHHAMVLTSDDRGATWTETGHFRFRLQFVERLGQIPLDILPGHRHGDVPLACPRLVDLDFQRQLGLLFRLSRLSFCVGISVFGTHQSAP